MKHVWRVRASRWLNRRLGGKPNMMLSTRVYVENRKQLEWMINFCFYVLRKEQGHCRNSLYLDALMEKIMDTCGLCEHRCEPFPFEVRLRVGNQTHDCGELCYKCVCYLQFVVNKFDAINMELIPNGNISGNSAENHSKSTDSQLD